MVANVKKILININNNEITFTYKTSNSTISNDLINTNIISNNELIFSDVYIKENSKILTSFIKELSEQYNVSKVNISKLELVPLIINLLSKSTSINYLYIKEDEALTYTICEELIKIKNIKTVNCYTLQPFMIELLDKNNITCETRSEILYMSNFMETNNLVKYSNIYYKSSIKITLPLSLEDINDFKDFCKINNYLKVVHINKLIPKELDNVIKILANYNKHNLRVLIHENVNDEKLVNQLKELNKSYKKNYHTTLSLEYSKEYLDNNIFKQTIINTLKVCGLIISSLVILVVTYIGVSNYVALKQVTAIQNSLAKVVEDTDVTDIIKKLNEENRKKAEEEKNNNEEQINPENPSENEPSEIDDQVKLVTNTELAALLTVNNDVVGQLKVNNTNVDYPVVKGSDNDYYLDHNIERKKNANGWIFMDYRNNPMNLDKNTIIYGHNMYYSGVMFGTLYKTANKSWYTNPDNQIITFNSLYEDMEFQIFSIYRVPKTNDYLKVYFKDDDDYMSFIKMVMDRSIYNFGVEVNADDKILTLSTCSNNGTKRLVIHAKLIKKNN